MTLDGTVIRIDPDTGLALPDNPRYTTRADANGKRIVAHGFRNPFRFTFRPGTRELWVGDVGWSTCEEINRIVDPIDGTVDNFGWPCYEGSRGRAATTADLPICQALYRAGPSAAVAAVLRLPHTGSRDPRRGVRHRQLVDLGTGVLPPAAAYPATYHDALFFADYSRKCVWAMRAGADGLPNPSTS